MAEDENVDIMSLNSELAERLGVVPTINSGAAPKPGFRARGRSPLLNASSARCPPACRSRGSSENLLVPELSAFVHMLPEEIISADQQQQALLFRLVFDAGVKAYNHLLQYVIATGTSGSDSVSSDSSEASWSTSRAYRDVPVHDQGEGRKNNRLPSVDSEAENLSMIERIDHAYETMIEIGDADIMPVSNAPEATPQLVANTLGLFAGAALRRPPTRAVECVMAASQESNTAQSDVDRHELYENQANQDNSFASCEDGLLVLACAAGFVDLVTEILRLRESTIFSSEIDVTPLMEAAAAGSSHVVSKLLEMKADVNAVSQTNNTPLIYAAAAGQQECVRLLLIHGGCDVTIRNDNGHDALMEAASSGSVNIVKMLIGVGARPSFVNMHSEFKESPLTLAAYKGHVDVVTYLLGLRDTLSDVNYQEEELHTALMEASMDGHYEVARVLLDAGAPPNMASESFESPLTLACCGGHDVLAKMLLDAGAYIEEPNDESYTPLMEAAREGHVNVVKVLLAHGANVNAQTEETGETAMTVAACGGYTDVLEELVRHGGDIELGGNTPLMEAAQEGHAQTVTFIIKASHQQGNCPNFVSHASTAVGLAAENGHLDVIELLCAAGADLNTEIDGRTPLMKACKNGSLSIVTFLLDRGVDVNTHSSHQDATALLLACASGHKDIVKLLLFRGADPNVELKDGISCVLEAARNGFVEIVELMLDHNGVPASSAPSYMPNAKKYTVPQTGVPRDPAKLAAMRRKKAQKAFAAPPDPSVNGPPVYAPSFQNNSENSDPTFARDYYSWLAGIYNSRIGEPSAFISQTLPTDLSCQHVMGHVRSLQQMMTQLAQSDEKWPNLDPTEFTELRVRQQAVKIARENERNQLEEDKKEGELANGVKGSQTVKSTIAATSAKFLASIYELGKKNFAGLPLPKTTPEQQATSPPVQIPPAPVTLPQTANAQPAAPQNYVLRPTVTSLPGGMVAAAGTTAPLPPMSFPTNPVPPPAPASHTAHRRTHSEGDESEAMRQNFAGKPNGSFNIDKATESNNDTPLTLACSNGHKDMIPILISRGANIEHRDKKGFTPLILAATGGHVGVVEALLAAGANIEAQSERTKDTALSLACSGGRKEVVELLLSKGANKEHRNVSDYTPLSLAASGGYVEIVNMLLNSGAEINSRTGSKLGISPLMLAAMNGHKDATRVLLEKGSDINAQIETNRNTALTLACFQGRTDVVRLLLHYNANVEHRAKTGLTPLMEAANGGYVEVGELLLENFADPNTTPVPSSRDTALTIAADKGHDKFVEMLLRHGAQIDARNKKGCTALWLACHGGHLDTVQVLVRHNADVDAQDNRKVSPLMIAFRKGFIRIVTYLVSHVKQYPSDQEMDRYLATLTVTESGKTEKEIKELMKNSGESMNIIKKAKTAQAEQANKAAEDLLALLAEEEERAKTKKQKKAKKREEKKQKQKEAKAKSPAAEPDDDSEEESEINNTSRDEISVAVAADPRVPQVVQTPVVPERPETAVTKQQQKKSRRSRQEAAKIPVAVANPPAPTSLSISTSAKPAAVLSPISPIVLVPKASPTDEWVKANPGKKKTTQKKGSLAAQQPKVQDFFSDESGAYGGWKDVELSRRRSNTLTVCNTVISRVIGRGGANINAIREATGASIEVEKQNTRSHQLDRQICIRGTSETVRNATCMINGLIADNDITVNDVIRQVLRGNTSVASSSSESGGKVGSAPEKLMATATTVKTSQPATASAPTNVWQQRMAARAAMQAQTKEPAHAVAAAAVVPEPRVTSPKEVVLEETVPELRQPSPVLSPPAPIAPIPVIPAAPFNSEEELRKAPGYRPQTAPSVLPQVESVSEKEFEKNEFVEERPLPPPIGQGFARAPGAKSNADDVPKSKDIGRLSFLENQEIADIWKGDGTKDSSNEPAWGSQLLLGNGLSNMLGTLNLGPSEWASSIASGADFSSTASSKPAAPVTTSAYDWIGVTQSTVPQTNSLYSRSNPARASISVPSSSVPSMTGNREAMLQQLAAQLAGQSNNSSGQQSSSSYYPSSSYPDNAMSQQAKSYMQAFQSANQEYENLNNLLNSYNNSHYNSSTNGDYGYPSSPATSRSMQTRPSSYAPPPGFANVTPTPPNMNSSSMAPPHMRNYYNGPSSQVPSLAQTNSAFSAYGQQQQQNNWSKLNTNGAPGSTWNSGGWN